jgi:hypothetical protein
MIINRNYSRTGIIICDNNNDINMAAVASDSCFFPYVGYTSFFFTHRFFVGGERGRGSRGQGHWDWSRAKRIVEVFETLVL